MKRAAGRFDASKRAAWAATAARALLGGVFVYMGLAKALNPVEFLKLVRQYELVDQSWALNFVAVAVPWIEVVCGSLLVVGIAVRGAAAVLGAMLAAFTIAIVGRALALQEANALPFCVIKFDCGCGAGEVLVCRKIPENIALVLLATFLMFSSSRRFCLRHTLLGVEPANTTGKEK